MITAVKYFALFMFVLSVFMVFYGLHINAPYYQVTQMGVNALVFVFLFFTFGKIDKTKKAIKKTDESIQKFRDLL